MDDQAKSMDCNLIQEQLASYVLDLLSEDERLRVSQHLEGCPDCRRLVEELFDTAHLLPQALAAASKVALPPSAKEELMKEMQSTSTRMKHPITFSLNRRAVQNFLEFLSFAWTRGKVRSSFFAFLVLAITIVSLVWNAHLSVALAKERSLRAEFANLVDQQELVLEVIDSDKTSRVFLRAAMEGSRSYGKLYTRADMAEVVVMAARLPKPPSGLAYHLWVIDQGEPVMAGTLKLNEEGFGMLVFNAGRDGPVYDEVLLLLGQPGLTQDKGTIVLRSERSP